MPKNGRNRTRRRAIRDIRYLHQEGPKRRVELVRLSELRTRQLTDHSIYELNRPDFHILLLFTQGRGRHHVDFEALTVSAGCVLHVRPKQIHSFDPSSKNEACIVLFRPDVLPPESETPPVSLLRPCPVRLSRGDFDRMRQICELIGSVSEQPSALDVTQVIDHLLLATWALYGQAARSVQTPRQQMPDDVARVRAFERSVEAHILERRGVDWHAAQARMSARTLARACQRVLGTSPKQHLDSLVALEARRRLAHSDASIEGIAAQMGFSEPTNFTKFFVRTTGSTPRAFRTRATHR